MGQLDAGTGIAVVFEDLLPGCDGGVGLAQGGEGFGIRHHGMTVVVHWFFAADLFKKRAGGGGILRAEETLAHVGAGVNVGRIAFERGAVAGFGLFQIALLEIDVAQLEVVMGLVEVVTSIRSNSPCER